MNARGSAAHAQTNAAVGMALFLGTLAMLFAALLLAYGVLRAQAPAWPPPGAVRPPRALLGGSTLVLLAASVVLHRGAPRVALGLGLLFLGLQAAAFRLSLAAGLAPDAGIYGSVFFGLCGLHALHAAGGIVALGAVLARRRPVRLALAYWDFLLVVWAVIYLVVCWL